MSTFAVTIEHIDRVWAHPNADRLELASLRGMTYQFCVGKGVYAAGDRVVYFPIDSLLPADLIEKLGLTGKLHGKDKNRISTVKLRGEISQGVVMRPADVLPADLNGHDLTTMLGITKYEPPEESIKEGRLVRLPDLVHVYDIEGADRYAAIAEMLMDVPVSITEKLEGSHFSASLFDNGDYAINQRRHRILVDEGKVHDWHLAAAEANVRPALDALWRRLTPKRVVTVRGELIGPKVQGNLYGLVKRRLYFFEIEVDGQPVPAITALGLLRDAGLCTAPQLAHGVTLREWLNERTVVEASTAPTALAEAGERILREGIVIRPLTEMSDPTFGRIILKQRSPEYLAWSGL